MIDENEAWIENNFTLKDSEKFKVMIRVYEDIFIDKKSFSKKIGVGRATIFDWIKKEKASFNTKSKTKICKGFGLLDTVWSDRFSTQESFEEQLPQYKKIEKSMKIRGQHIEIGLHQDNTKEKI